MRAAPSWLFLRVWAVLPLCLCLLGPAQAETVAQARAALLAGDAGRAAEIAETLLTEDAADPAAATLLGVLLRDGRGVTQDVPRAMALLREAAEAGSAPAWVALGRAWQEGRPGLVADPVEAQRAYEAAIDLGSNAARANLAALIRSGALGPPDYAALRSLVAEALIRGSDAARVQMAAFLAEGLGGPADPRRARAMAEAAHADSVPGAARLLAQMQAQGVGGRADPDAARATLTAAAEAGDAGAATDLAALLTDADAARALLARAAAAGDGVAALALGRQLSDGALRPEDDLPRATALFRQAHERGLGAGSHALALHLWDGIGVAADPDAAREVMAIAAARGVPGAMNDLGVMLETGVGGAADPDGARAAYRDAAEAGHGLGAWNLADLILSAPGRTRAAAVEGYAWCLRAIANEDDPALRLRHADGCGQYARALGPEIVAEATAIASGAVEGDAPAEEAVAPDQ